MSNPMDSFMSCEVCSAVIYKNLEGVCSDCVSQDRQDFNKVRAALKLHEVATVDEISERTGIRSKRIRAWVERGRLKIADQSG